MAKQGALTFVGTVRRQIRATVFFIIPVASSDTQSWTKKSRNKQPDAMPMNDRAEYRPENDTDVVSRPMIHLQMNNMLTIRAG